MNTNSDKIVLQIRQCFDSLLNSLFREQATVDEVEKKLLSSLLELGRQMMLAFILFQEAKLQHIKSVQVEGETLPLHSRRKRALRTIFGKIVFERGYYYRKDMSYYLLDAKLNLPKKSASDLLRQWLSQMACYMPYNKVGKIMGGLVGQKFSTRAIEDDVKEDGDLVEAYYQQAAPVAPEKEASILVLQGDGKGVPMRLMGGRNPDKVRVERGGRKSKKKEAIVTALYTLAPCLRTAQQVVDSLFKVEPAPKGERTGPQNKQLWATLSGKASACEFTAKQVVKRLGDHIKSKVALTDGCAPLQKQLIQRLEGFILVLDLIHALEYLWQAANALLGEKSAKREAWVKQRLLLMLNGQTNQIIAEFKELAQKPGCKKLAQSRLLAVAAYYERNLEYMHYDQYLASGWPIATGVIEGACRHLVKDRCELSGMRWSEPGAESLLGLRCVAENDDWEDFQLFRKSYRSEHEYHGGISEVTNLNDAVLSATQTASELRAA